MTIYDLALACLAEASLELHRFKLVRQMECGFALRVFCQSRNGTPRGGGIWKEAGL